MYLITQTLPLPPLQKCQKMPYRYLNQAKNKHILVRLLNVRNTFLEPQDIVLSYSNLKPSVRVSCVKTSPAQGLLAIALNAKLFDT